MSIELLGIIGGLCFAGCGVPAAFQTIKAGKSLGTPISVAWMIFIGALSMYAYLSIKHGFDWVLFFSYGVEISSWFIIVFYHHMEGIWNGKR